MSYNANLSSHKTTVGAEQDRLRKSHADILNRELTISFQENSLASKEKELAYKEKQQAKKELQELAATRRRMEELHAAQGVEAQKVSPRQKLRWFPLVLVPFTPGTRYGR
jgi:hypothetical protein